MSSAVTILLSIYGEAPFLEDFLKSLERQSCRDFRLLCRFDDPADHARSREILRKYGFVGILAEESHCGVVETYNRLLKAAAGAPYVMFADQDDIWHPDKIETALARMRRAEREFSSAVPILCHSDLRVVAEDLREISPSFMKYQTLDSRRRRFRELLIQNNVTGCTVIINRALAERVNFPAEAICHDWYLALIASAFGKIVFEDRATIDYRQHAGNCYGAVPRKNLFSGVFARRKLRERLLLTQRQAGAFLEQFGAELPSGTRELLAAWSALPEERSYCRRLFTVWKYHLVKNDLLRTLGLWWAV